MNFEELLQFIDIQDKKLIKLDREASTEKEKVLARTVKLTEELGELCDEVLAFNGDQRKDKLDKKDEDSLPGEFADVVIVTLLLAKTMNIDIKKALENKIKKINKRFKDIEV